MQTEIKQTWFFEHTPETVWEYLVTPELLSQWLMPNDIKPVIGYKFRFTTQPMPQSGFDGIINCKVLEVVLHKRLSYSWQGGPGNGQITLDTIVTWTLAPKENGTELNLLQTGFTATNQMTHTILNEGWGKHVKDRLNALINKTTHETANH